LGLRNYLGGVSKLERSSKSPLGDIEEANIRPLWKYIPSSKNLIPEEIPLVKKGKKKLFDETTNSPRE